MTAQRTASRRTRPKKIKKLTGRRIVFRCIVALFYIAAAFFIIKWITGMCSEETPAGGAGTENAYSQFQDIYGIESLDKILAPSRPYYESSGSAEAPDTGQQKLKINFRAPLPQTFNDSNYLHLEAAKALGIKPISSLEDTWREGSKLVRTVSNKDFHVDTLNHSYPYLVPAAYRLLHDIGRSFNDSLEARGGGNYRLKVTSVLRTPETVSKLKRVNRNATGESAHTYGTTFDISFSRFIYDGPGKPNRSFEDLKNLLAEILVNYSRQGRCYVKYERRQSCFHITVRPPEDFNNSSTANNEHTGATRRG